MNERDWLTFYEAARKIKRGLRMSPGAAQTKLRELCASGSVRSKKEPYSFVAGQPQGEGPPVLIEPSEWRQREIDVMTDSDGCKYLVDPHRSDEGGTRSLRFSYSKPPLQLMSAHDEEIAPLIRGVFLPEEGEVWAKPDISQQEFRFIVHYAEELQLPRAKEAGDRYRENPDTDFHALVSDWTGIVRQQAKNTNFAKAFGAGVRKFAAMIGKSESAAAEIYSKCDRELPFVSALARYCEQQAKRFGHIELYDGARRHWNAWVARADWGKGSGPCSREEAERRIADPDHPWYRRGPLYRADTHKALNALIQGSAARHTKLWMRACWREGIVPLLQMHDSLDCSVSSLEQAERVAQLACEVVSLAVPIRVDLGFGRNWADAKHTWAELHGQAQPITQAESIKQAEFEEINAGLIREGIAPLMTPTRRQAVKLRMGRAQGRNRGRVITDAGQWSRH